MRTVARLAMRVEVGEDSWTGLPPHVIEFINDNAALATRKRPHEQLADPWDAAGMPAIRALLA